MAMSTAQELRLEGRVQGKIEGEKNAILRYLETRFAKVPKSVSDAVNAYSDLTALQSLSAHAWSCQTLDEFADGLR